MTLEKDIVLFREVNKALSSIEKEDISNWLITQSSPDRVNFLKSIIDGEESLELHDRLDILLYVLKSICWEKYDSLDSMSHLCSHSEIYEYDPAKNGQNIVKHGISFSEVVSYASKFGALMVQCPDDTDLHRIVIFSDLSNLNEQYKLMAPISSSDLSGSFVLSIVQNRELRFRFISSRLISKKRYLKTLRNALKNIYPNDPNKRDDFINRCLEVLKVNLIGNNA